MLFAERYQPPQQQPVLVRMRSANDPGSAKVIFDPNAASAKGSLSVDFYVPSFGGKYVAVAMSENGSEDSAAHIFEVATGKELSDLVPRVNFATAGGSIAWKADGSGFYYRWSESPVLQQSVTKLEHKAERWNKPCTSSLAAAGALRRRPLARPPAG